MISSMRKMYDAAFKAKVAFEAANGPDHKVYPYLLKGVAVERPDQA